MSDITRPKRNSKKTILFTPETAIRKSPRKSKKDFFTKKNVNPREVAIQKYIYDLNVVNTPKVVAYNPKTRVIKMENIPNLSVADYFGSKIEDVPEEIIEMIRKAVSIIYKAGVEFSDITGYNFLYDDKLDSIWVIDYGNARFLEDIKSAEKGDFERDDFVEEFLDGLNSWNPAFL